MSTTEILVARGKKLAAVTGALTAAVALGATLSVASPAHATPEPITTMKPYGTVTAKMGLSARQYPSTDASVRGYYRHRAQIGLVCKVRTQSVGGNSVWYLTREERGSWITAKYVTNAGYVKYCKDVQRGGIRPGSGNAAKHAVG
ncbi:SH3 domain-containing protein [Streptomyces sp. NPDC048506]|uniref:SH3 domain-containing protein n=1 Tax=Streptomyces sp. NPDC048506 TaxID=3155028 RepID=UPI0034359EE5